MSKPKIIDVRKLEILDMNYDMEISGFSSCSCYAPYFSDPSTCPAEVEARVNHQFEEGLAKIS